MTFKTLICEGDRGSTKSCSFPSVVNRHLTDIFLCVDDPLRELPAGSRANLLVSVLCKDPIVELLAHLCFQ
jgi:hypothetical protein